MLLPLVIINPESAGGTTREAWPKIASELATHFGSFEPRFTRNAGEATELAAVAARNWVFFRAGPVETFVRRLAFQLEQVTLPEFFATVARV
jgi:hypothetical protein